MIIGTRGGLCNRFLPGKLENPLAVEVDHDGRGHTDGRKHIPRQTDVVRLVEGLGELRGTFAGDLDQLVEGFAVGHGGDLLGREAVIDQHLARKFILGREDVVKLRAEFAFNRPADQRFAVESPDVLPWNTARSAPRRDYRYTISSGE